MKKLKTTIAILLTFTMILTGGASLSLLAVSAETNSSSAEEQVNESAGGSDEQKDQKDQEKNSSDKEKSDKAEKKSKGSSSDASDSKDTIKKRDIEAKLVKEDLFKDKEEKKKTDTYKSLISFWGSLWDRDPSVSKKDTDLKVTVSGKMPEGIKAEAEFINSGNTTAFSEQGMLKFRLTLFDKDGNVYVPDEAVKVSVEGKSLKEELKDENAPIVYTYESVPERAKQLKEKYDKEFYTADVKVYKSKKADKKLLRYEVYDKDKEYKNGKDAVRYFNDKDGLKTDEDTVTFEYDFNSSYGEGSARYKAGENGKDAGKDSAVFVLSSQMKERTLTASAGDAKITVTGPLDKDVTLKATEITKKDKAYAGYVEETAKQLDKEKSELYMARAFDIKLIDSTTGKEFEPDSDVKVDIDLGDKKIDDDTDLDVVHFRDKSDKKPEVIDASADGSTVKFKTDGFSVYVVAQTEKETVLTAKDGKKYKITVSYGRAAEIPDDAELSARELTDDEYEEYYKKAGDALDVNKFSYARIFDISIVGKDGKEYQPKDDVSVTIELMDDEDNEELKVVHFGDKMEVLDAKTEGDEVSFKTDSFSIFAVVDNGQLVDENGNPVYVRTYRFYTYTSEGDPIEYQVATDQGTTTAAQRIKNGEKPVAPILTEDPTDEGGVFEGWYEDIGQGDTVELADKAYDFNNIPEITKNEEVHLYAKFKTTVTVTFYEQHYDGNEGEEGFFPVAATRKVELETDGEGHKSGTLDISDMTTKYYDSEDNGSPKMEFDGWSYAPVSTPGSPTDDDGNPVSKITGNEITITESTKLYPLFRSVKWLTFYSGEAGTGATYFSPKSFPEGGELTSLSDYIPARDRHTFEGWYTGTLTESDDSETVEYRTKIANADGSLVTGATDDEKGVKVEDGKLKLTSNATIFAKWTEDPDAPKPPEPDTWYLVKIDPNGGALYSEDGELPGTGSTWFWPAKLSAEGGEPIEEYTNVSRDFVESATGDYYYANQNRAYYGYPDTYVDGESPNRKTFYTKDISKATSLNTYKKQPGAYRYAGWYEVHSDGTETPYEFGHPVNHDTTLKLHWKKAGQYFIEYDPVMNSGSKKITGTMAEGADDENGYADSASIQLTRMAIAPEGYEFIGWSIRGDDSNRVYRTDETFNLPAQYAVTVNGKSKVFFEAVYVKAGTAKIIFDANKGTLKEGLPADFQYVETEYTEKPVFSVGTDKKSVHVDRMVNNGVYKLSETEFFTRENCVFTGWNTKADGTGKHYDAGSEYGLDSNEPVTLYAEWKVKVYFDKNDNGAAWNESAWGTEKTDGSGKTYYEGKEDKRKYYKEEDGDKYYTLVDVDAVMTEPDITPSDTSNSFNYWSETSGSSAEPFEFGKTKITGEITLYAHWTTDALVPLHVFTYDPSDSDADAIDRDGWRKTSKIELAADTPKSISDICSDYLNIPEEYADGYKYVYAYAGTEIDKSKVDNNSVTELQADSSGKVTLTYQTGDPGELQDGQALYLVYEPKITEKQINIKYVKESSGGALTEVEGAVAGKITYNSEEMQLNEKYEESGRLNDATVSQNQTLKMTTKDLLVSQSSTNNFTMPSRLDDGDKQLELVYGKIGTGNSGAANISALDSDTGKILHLQVRDGKAQWSYDGEKWHKFSTEEGYTPTLYAVYRERGHELEITKAVTKDTEVRDYKKFKVTVTSLAITQKSYSVEGTGYKTVDAIPASGDTPGKIELSVKHGSDIIISGLAEGEYTIEETENENYNLTAKTGEPTGEMSDTGVTDNTTLDPITLDKDMKAALSNEPETICRVENPVNSGTYEEFFTLNDALELINRDLDGKATIEMLVNYAMPSKDALTIPSGSDIEITTAPGGAFKDGSGPAVISRDSEFTKGAMFDNRGALTFANITLDGKGAEVSGEMVHSEAEISDDEEIKSGLYIGDNTTFRNANNTGNGGAVNVSMGKAYISGGSFENNAAAKGGAIYVSSGELEITGGTIGSSGKGNHADKGGAIYYAGSGEVKISGGTISHNTADKGNGGAIYAENGTINVSGGSITINKALSGNGGAIFVESAIINVSGKNTSINSNSAKSGGAIYFDQSGTFTMNAGSISNNTATAGNGGALRMTEGTADISGGSLTGNKANAGNGGAVSGGGAAVTVSKGTFSSNEAKNGSAVFADTGRGVFTGGTITGNISSEGGAVGVGSNTAKLEFSAKPVIKENPRGSAGSGEYANVCLDQDTDGVISVGSFSSGAEIGIYVPGPYSNDLFKNRGQAGSVFGTFTSTYADKTVIAEIKNDRLGNLQAITRASTNGLLWGKTIEVEVRYKYNFESGFPPNVSSTKNTTIPNYYLPASNNSVSSIAEDLRNNYTINGLTNTAVFAGAFSVGDTAYSEYLTDVNWYNGVENQSDTSGWKYVRRYKDAQGQFVTGDLTKLIVYYSEPAYISIENNTDYTLEVTDLEVFEHCAINGTALNDAGYGYVYAENGAIRNELKPITSEDLTLSKMKSIKLVFPGAVGSSSDKTYTLTGKYTNVPTGNSIPVRITSPSTSTPYESSVPQDKISRFTLGTSGSCDIKNTPPIPQKVIGGSVDIVFGGNKPICKIETTQVTPVAADKITAQTDPDSSGKVQYCFSTLTDAKNFAVNHTIKTIAIEMLVDYLIPSTDTLVVPAGYDITLKTAVKPSGSAEGYYYEGDRATISRDSDNMNSFITSDGGASTTLQIDNLKFDGKSLGGNIDGGVVKTSQCVVIIAYAEFVNCIANNGGGMYIAKGNRDDVNLSVSYTDFENCRSKSTLQRQGGGAIWTDVRRNTTVTDSDKQGLYLFKCNFTNCSAYDQGGAVFHRVDKDLDTVTTVNTCQFIGCEANAAGGMESGAKAVKLIDSTFRNCTAKDRNGGGANFYSLNSATPTADCSVRATGCTFDNCRATNMDTKERYGGGFRSTATHTYLTDCKFTNCIAKRGAGIGISSKNAKVAEIHGCVIDGCTAATEYGGGIFCMALTLTIDDKISETETKRTQIKNCTAGTYGGGIRHDRDAAGTSLTITNTDITGNSSTGSGNNGNGGGISVKGIRNVTITGSTIEKNTAKSTGGGINMGSSGTDRRLTLDDTDVKENRSGSKGGGIYCESQLTLKNDSMVTKNAVSTTAADLAGIYLIDNRTLTVGDENATKADESSVINNATDGGAASNMRLWSATTGDKLNNAASVYVNCNLKGRIGVVNASTKYTQFGSSGIANPQGFGYADGTQVFRSDDDTLFGVIDRADNQGKRIIWRGDVICKITDASGHLLYLDSNGEDPAVFDSLDDDKKVNPGKKSAFSYLRNASPALYYKDGTSYTGAYCVKLLESYKAVYQIVTYTGIGRNITLTTAGRTDADYPYRGKAGTAATITRDTKNNAASMIIAGCTLTLQNITIDGAKTSSSNTRILQTLPDNAGTGYVTIGNKATLQNARSSGNGGAVFATGINNKVILDGGEIKNCEANNGGGVYKEGRSIFTIVSGNITSCKATENGGGVYYYYKNTDYNSHIFVMEGGSITKCAAKNGGGVYIANNAIMRMSGGNIKNNTATSNGGGISIAGNKAKVYFSGRVTISGNKMSGDDCNVQLDFDSNEVINTTGLDRRAYIGIYVPNGTNLYDKHGVAGKPFGKYTSDTGAANLQRFINDRNGCKGGVLPGGLANTVYWVEGTRNVILRKVSDSYHSLEGAKLTVYYDTEGNVASDANGTKLEGLSSNGAGAFFAGELYYGTYYIKETKAPEGYSKPNEGYYFIVTVSSNGVGYQHGNEYDKEVRLTNTNN